MKCLYCGNEVKKDLGDYIFCFKCNMHYSNALNEHYWKYHDKHILIK
jgi:hypothetical protein